MDSKICVLGLAYICLPTASILAVHGLSVVGVDFNPEVVENVNNGSPHIVEPGLESLVKEATYSDILSQVGLVDGVQLACECTNLLKKTA